MGQVILSPKKIYFIYYNKLNGVTPGKIEGQSITSPFYSNCMVGKLARWLRLLGFDVKLLFQNRR
jgi:hypothetical protein